MVSVSRELPRSPWPPGNKRARGAVYEKADCCARESSYIRKETKRSHEHVCARVNFLPWPWHQRFRSNLRERAYFCTLTRPSWLTSSFFFSLFFFVARIDISCNACTPRRIKVRAEHVSREEIKRFASEWCVARSPENRTKLDYSLWSNETR